MIRSLLLLILIIQPVHAEFDGRWQLTILGRDRLEFGTEHLAGGLSLEWESVLAFSIENGLFKQGTGTARLLPDIVAVSRPDGMFACEQVSGTFANNNGQSFSTPHLRYKSFPLLGKVEKTMIRLNPHLDYPGNYYAVLYQCQTNNSLGSFWLEASPRIARELSKRQNALVNAKSGDYSAHVKEVKAIAPGPELEIPLVDGFQFSVTEEYGMRKLDYQLERIKDPDGALR